MNDELKEPGTVAETLGGKARPPQKIYEPAMQMQEAIGLFDQIMRFTKEAMKEGINGDFATIPGTNKPTLLKPGAEKLMIWFNLIPDPFITQTEKIPDGEGFILSVDTTIILRDKHGNIRGQCQANCNSGEDKYREQTRWLTEKKLQDQGLTPDGLEHQDRQSKFGSGGTYRVYKVVSSSNAYQLLNTLKKMSQKRAYVGAIIQATATSGIFTQDMEDSGDKKSEKKSEKKDEPGNLNNQREKAHVLLKKCLDADKVKAESRKTWEGKIADAKSDKAIEAVISSLQTFADQGGA